VSEMQPALILAILWDLIMDMFYDHVIISQADLDDLNASAVAATNGEVTEYKAGAFTRRPCMERYRW